MKLLLDTQLLLWAVAATAKLPEAARTAIEDEATDLWFSVVALWEVAIKCGRGRPDFTIEPAALRVALLEAGYFELPVLGIHVIEVRGLPPIHRDPFDRLLLAQARVEGMALMTTDTALARYGEPIIDV